MAQSYIITLTTAGEDTGPFDLYSNIDGFTLAFETNVAKPDLVSGYLTALVPDGTSTIRVKSSGVLCSTYVDLAAPASTTTTTSSTSSTTTTTSTTTEAPTTTTTTTAAPTIATVNIGANLSSDISINSVSVNSVPAEYVSGQALPNTPGNSTELSTDQLGTYTVEVDCTSATGGQHITLTDSNGIDQCQNVSAGGNILVFTGVAVHTSNPVSIVADVGIC